jgi:hypothetical protein
MLFLGEIIGVIIKPILFVIGAVLTYIFGDILYQRIDSILYIFSAPCLADISFIVAFVSPVSYFFGVHHRKFIFNRPYAHNLLLFILSFLFGFLLVFLPVNALPYCHNQPILSDKVTQGFYAGILTSLIAFVSLDFGVFYAKVIRGNLTKKGSGK